MKSVKLQLLVTLVAMLVIPAVGFVVYREYHKAQFINHLGLVYFSTSLIGTPRDERVRQAAAEAEELGVDLFAAYTANLENGCHYDLAWLLIRSESAAYLDFVGRHVATVRWPEVRIWRVMRSSESLSPAYRQGLLNAMLASPTSEGRLAAAYWYEKAGRQEEMESACLDVLAAGASFDSFDAAYLLANSKRYRTTAVRHLLSVVRTENHLAGGAAAGHLAVIYSASDQFDPLIRAYVDSPSAATKRQLVEALEKLAGSDATDKPAR
jgi:hypothetical protein